MKNKKTQNGFSVIELIFYVSLFAILSMSVTSAIVSMTQSFRETAIHAELVESSSIMERMSREIKQATGINSLSASDLVLNTTDENDVAMTIQFRLSGSNIEMLEDGVLIGNLNASSIVITGLTFTQITTTAGTAVKVIYTVRSTKDSLARTQDYYNTVVIRGDY